MIIKEHKLNQSNNFIMGWYLDPKVCDSIIEYHKNAVDNNLAYPAVTGSENGMTFDPSVKDSTDVLYAPTQNDTYLNLLWNCTKLYNQKYTYAVCAGYKLYHNILIQHYNLGGGYKNWHCERGSADTNISSRHLVFMTYLNDLDDGGTDFYYQNLTVKAEKGLTLIWPADFTFTHKSQVSHTSQKYIITGWFTLLNTPLNQQELK